MRYLVLFLLMTSAVLAIDVKRVGTHTLDENLTDTVSYVEYNYGDFINKTQQLIDTYKSDFDYIKERSGPLIISRWSMTSSNDTLMISVTGVFPGFVTVEGDRYKIDGKGFIDNLCTEYPSNYIGKIDQEFDFTIFVPDSLTIVSVPTNRSENLTHIFYNLSVEKEGNKVHRNVRFVVKEDVDVFSYCEERARLDSLLKQGIIAKRSLTQADPLALLLILTTLGLLVLSMLYLVKK